MQRETNTHVEIMFSRLRLLMIEAFPDINEIMSDVDGLMGSGNCIVVPIAARAGIEVLTRENPLPVENIQRAVELAKKALTYTGHGNILLVKALNEIELFRNWAEKGGKKPLWVGSGFAPYIFNIVREKVD